MLDITPYKTTLHKSWTLKPHEKPQKNTFVRTMEKKIQYKFGKFQKQFKDLVTFTSIG